ncbi:hypothetical protein FAGAP_4180 [Fusarium agapanthi]|uniref:Uncharacterized protein n=1 Tax=Fusarium agapanthi TaxID=1803897 RepID=A0A9P5BFM8_9HYPO|nr:hypothetical protein FAGAP_4180 [Fusarium agapanthi]
MNEKATISEASDPPQTLAGNARGRLEPPAFAAVDYEGLWFSKLTRASKPEFLHHHTIILNGATKAEEYGELIHWDSHPDAEEWALREGPAYFSKQFREMLDHREEMLPDSNGNPHPVLQPYRINTLWSRVICNMVMHAYSNLQAFTILYGKVISLIELEQNAHKDIDPAKDLPAKYFGHLMLFKFFLDQAVEVPLEQLEHSSFATPPVRKHFVRMPPPDPYTSDMNVIPRSQKKITGVDKQVMYLIHTLWQDSWGLFIARLPLTVDELERLIQSDPKADALISGHVAKILGDIAIIGRCLKQLELYQPWAAQFDQAIDSDIELYQKCWGRIRGNYGQLNEAFLRREFDEAARLAEPSGGKFTYPYSKRRTKETVDALRRAEANLDIVWAKIKGDPTEPAPTEEVTLPAVQAEPATEATQPTFAVDAKALKVFRTLFFDPEVTSTPGLIPWNDLLYAMAATGLKIEKLYGSVWQLTPTQLDVERGIHFHEPHPMGKIPFETARRHGRRLARAYDWHGDLGILTYSAAIAPTSPCMRP